MHYFTNAIKKYFILNGRASRKEYIMFFLWVFSLAFLVVIVANIFEYSVEGMVGIFAFFVLIPSITMAVRRLHDMNKSGWWLLSPLTIFPIVYLLIIFKSTLLLLLWPLMFFAPILPILLVIFPCIIKGTVGPNIYGADPYGDGTLANDAPAPEAPVELKSRQ